MLRSPRKARDGLLEPGKEGEFQLTSNCIDSHGTHSLEKHVLGDPLGSGLKDNQQD